VSGRVSCQGSNSASTACGFGLDSSPAQTHTRHSPGNIGNAGNLDAPMGLHAVNVETARPRSTGGDHRVIKCDFDNCLAASRGRLDAPDGLYAVDVEGAASWCAGADDGVIEHGADDGVTTAQAELWPACAQFAAVAG
jgi:hypothetical protein